MRIAHTVHCYVSSPLAVSTDLDLNKRMIESEESKKDRLDGDGDGDGALLVCPSASGCNNDCQMALEGCNGELALGLGLGTDGLELAIMGAGDVQCVTEFLIRHFFTEEPLGKALDVDPETEIRPWLADMVAHQIQESISIVIRNVADGQLVAVCLNDVDRSQPSADDVTIFTSVHKDRHPAMWKIIHLLDDLMGNVDLFNRYQVEAYVVLQIMSVSPQYGGRGLGRKMIDVTEMLSKQRGYSLIISEATSRFSASAFLKAGFHSHNSIQYATYRIGDSQPFQHVGDIHTQADLMIKSV